MSEHFPFSLDDIQAWIIRRKDGTVVRYNLVNADSVTKLASKPKTIWNNTTSYSNWCDHEPWPQKQAPIFEHDGIGLWIADAPGARKTYKEFDVAIDGGSVLTVPGEHDLPNIYGDPKFRSALLRHVYSTQNVDEESTATRIIKLRWFDRAAPPVYPSFWPALLKELQKLRDKTPDKKLKVLTICQGGHGRSGSALALLTMCMTDYSPLDALTHIRALHCARAIESKEQHLYLNQVAALLGREENALEAEGVSSFKQRFLDSANKFMEPYKERLRQGAGSTTEVSDRGGTFI
jgi:protein-tyrosine phosphatase